MTAFEQRILGRTGVHTTAMGIGGVGLGERLERIEEATAVATMEAAYDLGVRYFDTSPWYGHGLSEHRMGHVLRNRSRDEFVLASKVGRLFFRPEAPHAYRPEVWAGGLPFDYRFDYSADGIRRSYEDSLQRLGMNRIDLLLVHDLDLRFHETDAGMDKHIADLDAGGGWQVLADMRARGEIRGIGFGINFTGLIPRWLDLFDPDFFLVAMPYTLLDQDALDEDLPRCAERDVGIVIGSVYSSGILATGVSDGAVYRYGAPPADVVDRVRGIEAVCARHDVPMRAAALQFPLGHDSVAAIIPGAISPDQVRENVTLLQRPIAGDFWAELKAEGLLRGDAPTP